MLYFLHLQRSCTTQSTLFLKSLPVLLLGCSVYCTTLPPIIDLYEPVLSQKEVAALQQTIRDLRNELNRIKATSVPEKTLTDKSPSNALSLTQRFMKFFSTQNKQGTSNRRLLDAEAEKRWKKVIQRLDAKQYAKTLYQLKTFIKTYPSHTHTATAYYLVGQLSLLEGHPDDTLHYLKTFLAKYSKDSRVPEAYLHMGLAYYAKKNHTQAIELFNRLEKNYPSHPMAQEAKRHLQMIHLKT